MNLYIRLVRNYWQLFGFLQTRLLMLVYYKYIAVMWLANKMKNQYYINQPVFKIRRLPAPSINHLLALSRGQPPPLASFVSHLRQACLFSVALTNKKNKVKQKKKQNIVFGWKVSCLLEIHFKKGQLLLPSVSICKQRKWWSDSPRNCSIHHYQVVAIID